MSRSLSFQEEAEHPNVTPTLDILLSLCSESVRGTLTLRQCTDLLHNLNNLR